jgi:hypothetical protein
MSLKKYEIFSKLFDQQVGDLTFTKVSSETGSIEFYTTKYGKNDAAYIITENGYLLLHGEVTTLIKDMLGITMKEFTEFATIKLNTKITLIL